MCEFLIREISKRIRVNFAWSTFFPISSSLLLIFLLILSNLGVGYPLFDFMSSPVGRFDDYRNPLIYAPKLFESHIGVGFTPIQVLIYQILSHFPFYMGLFLSSAVPIIAISYGVFKQPRWGALPALLIGLFPIIFCLARGNNDLWVLALLFWFYRYLQVGNQKYAGIVLALAVAIDPLMAFFGVLCLKRNYIKFWSYFIFTELASFAIPCILNSANPLYEFKNLVMQYSTYREGMVTGDAGLLFSNSLSGMFKGFYYASSNLPITSVYLNSVLMISNALGLLLLIHIVLRLSFQKSIPISASFVGIASFLVLFGSASPDYKLIYFLVPLLCDWKQLIGKRIILGVMFALLFLPKHFVWYQFDFNPVGFTLNSILNPILIIIITLLLAFKPGTSTLGNSKK